MSTNNFSNATGGSPRPSGTAVRIINVLAAIIRFWALLGGLIVTGLAVLTAASAVSNVLFSKPFSADYELVKHFTAIIIFMFLPYCQLVGANVTVDIFTEGMSEAKKAAMSAFSSFFAIAFSLLLLRQMWFGFFSYMKYPEVTPVLQLPLWTAFPPILVSLLFLLIAAAITLLDGWRIMRGLPAFIRQSHELPVE